MNGAEFCISWESYLKQVSQGLSLLQQNAEFVDMTLAADGHLVKVHQNIMALASPYLKAMLQSAKCPHPVIFLNNISHEILGYILAYIYMGEVKLPISLIGKFIDACKALSIRGVDAISAPQTIVTQPEPPIERINILPDNNIQAQFTANTHNNNCNEDCNIVCRQSDNNRYNINDEEIPLESENLLTSTTIVPDNIRNAKPDTEHIVALEDYEAHIDNDIDINSINKFIIMKNNNNASGNAAVDVSARKSPCEIAISNDWETASASTNMQQNYAIEDPINIILNANPAQQPVDIILNRNQYENPSQHNTVMLNTNIGESLTPETWHYALPSSQHAEPNANPVANLVNIALSTNDRLPIEDTTAKPLTLNEYNRKDVQNSLKKIRTHIKSQNQAKKRVTLTKDLRREMDQVPHYTISNRGSLQLLLECFLYNLHHHSSGGRKRRWRCIEYRRNHCQSFIDTVDDQVTAAPADHSHPNHDKQIRTKIQSNIIFTSLTHATNTINYCLRNEDSTKTKDISAGRRKLKRK